MLSLLSSRLDCATSIDKFAVCILQFDPRTIYVLLRMETTTGSPLTATLYSLVGIQDILYSIIEDVVDPHQQKFKYDPHNSSLHGGECSPPKFILMSGDQGCGLSSTCSVLVNELRRGSQRKRGDIFYTNRRVSYLEWDNRAFCQGSVKIERLRQLFKSATNPKNGEPDLTVIRFPNFHCLCPRPPPPMNDGDDRDERLVELREAQLGFIKAFDAQLKAIPAGKILIIATSSCPNQIDSNIRDQVDFTYNLPYPNEQTRAELIWQVLREENAFLLPDVSIEYLVTATSPKFSCADVKFVVESTLTRARSRANGGRSPRNRQLGRSLPTPTGIGYQDFFSVLELYY